jgi:hypothetical protein
MGSAAGDRRTIDGGTRSPTGPEDAVSSHCTELELVCSVGRRDDQVLRRESPISLERLQSGIAHLLRNLSEIKATHVVAAKETSQRSVETRESPRARSLHRSSRSRRAPMLLRVQQNSGGDHLERKFGASAGD